MRLKYAESVAALAVLLAVTVGCFWPLFRHPGAVLVGPQRSGSNDLTSYFIACHSYPRLCWERFRQPPWWNPYSLCGVPYVGNPQSAVYYPPNWLCWWADAPHVLSWLLVAHHLLGGIGAYRLCVRYGGSWIGSATGGAVFMAAPYLVAQTGEGHYAQLCVAAWMPWAFLTYESVREGRRCGVAGMTVVLAMSFFAGHVQEVYYLGLILTAWLLVDALGLWRAVRRAECGRLVRGTLLLGAGAAGLVAVDLLPMLVYATQMRRASGLSAAEASAIGLRLPNLLQLINPFALGGPQSYGGRDKLFWETLCSFGLAPLVLAVVGVVSGWGRYPVRRFAWSCLVAFAFAFGGGPVFRCLYALIPGMSLFRVPSRALFFCSLAVAVLAANGADSLLAASHAWREQSKRAWRHAAIAVVGLCLAWIMVCKLGDRESVGEERAAAATHETDEQRRGIDTPPSAVLSDANDERHTMHRHESEFLSVVLRRTFGSRTPGVWLIGSMALIYAALRAPKAAPTSALGLLGLCVAQLGLCASRILMTVPVADQFGPDSVTRAFRAESDSFRVLCPQRFISDRQAWESGAAKIEGYEPVPLARYVTLFAALTGKPAPASRLSGFSSPDLLSLRPNVLDLMNVRSVVVESRVIDRGFDAERLGWQDRSQDFALADLRHFENPNALPRAFVVGTAKVIEQGESPAQAIAQLRPGREVLLQGYDLWTGPRAAFAPAMIVEYTANRVTIEADLSARGYLVLSDTWYPGWSAEDNGRAVAVRPANIAFRAVPLAAGQHHVVFRYQPSGLVPGAAISGLAWIVVFGRFAVALAFHVRRLGPVFARDTRATRFIAKSSVDTVRRRGLP